MTQINEPQQRQTKVHMQGCEEIGLQFEMCSHKNQLGRRLPDKDLFTPPASAYAIIGFSTRNGATSNI